MTVEITCTVRGNPPSVPFEKTAKDILKSGYNLSLVLCGDALSRRINREYSEAPRSLTRGIRAEFSEVNLPCFARASQGSPRFHPHDKPRSMRRRRKKDYPANVLSFPLSKHEGEIFLNVRKAEREAKVAGISARANRTFVHTRMSSSPRISTRHRYGKLERNTLKKFGFHPVT